MRFTKLFQRLVIAFALLAAVASAQPEKITLDHLIAKHTQSIGKSTVPTDSVRVLQGRVVFDETIGKSLHLEGSSTVFVQGKKFKSSFQFGNRQYPGEQIVFDGEKAIVGILDASNRSNLGNFLHTQNKLLEEGLFGGTLSGGWPLLSAANSEAKLKYKGTKKIVGRELHDLLYVPKKSSGSGDLTIHLYFETGTYRHVMTVYAVTFNDSIATGQASADATTQTLEEHFDDFREMNGLMLPSRWILRFRVTPQAKPREYQWESRFDQMQVLEN